MGHNKQQSIEFHAVNNKVILSRPVFVSWLAEKSVKRFSWIMWWRKKQNSGKLKKRMSEYNSIIDSCIGGYIQQEVREGVVYIRTTPQGDDFLGFTDLFEKLIGTYKSTWGYILLPLITFIIGVVNSERIKVLIGYLLGIFK